MTQKQSTCTPTGAVLSRKENRRLHQLDPSSSSLSSDSFVGLESHNNKQQSSETSEQIHTTPRYGEGLNKMPSRVNNADETDGTSFEDQAGLEEGDTVAGRAQGPLSAMRKGTKRVRNFTPASARAIDEEDEPRRRSPSLRQTSGTKTSTETYDM
jgi:hypothetical protein